MQQLRTKSLVIGPAPKELGGMAAYVVDHYAALNLRDEDDRENFMNFWVAATKADYTPGSDVAYILPNIGTHVFSVIDDIEGEYTVFEVTI